MDAELSQYINQHLPIRGLSAHTIDAYRRDLCWIKTRLNAKSIEHWQDAQVADLRALFAEAFRQGHSAKTIARRISALRRFFEFGRRQWDWQTTAVDTLKAPKSEKRLPKVVEIESISALLDDMAKADDWLSIRDSAMFELIYSSGLRVSEAAALRLEDLDIEQGLVRVFGKGQKVRVVPVGRAAVNALERWLSARCEITDSNENTVFLTQKGKPISVRTIQQQLKKRGVEAGIAGLHPHTLRHSFATHLLQSSGQLRAVQELLGHADLSTTQVYTHLDYQRLAVVYDQAHPLAKAD
ncbi:MAG: tyrosine recombinase XerC [Gammaproteobacteria bacterium]|nr:tyrosine recombinase XerC [Gammaproteobacteria bacterium]